MRILAPLAVVVLALCACSGSGSLPAQLPGVSSQPERRDLPDAGKPAKRLFVSDPGTGDIYLYAVPSLKLVTILQGFARPQGECANDKGDVFVADGSANIIYELSYSGRTEAQLSDASGPPNGCAFDSKTGNLAVFDYIGKQSAAGAVLVYHHAAGSPNAYSNPNQFYYSFGGYDASGNLFFDGANAQGKFMLSELPAAAGSAHTLTISGGKIYSAGMVQWDSASGYLDVGDQKCGNTATSCLYQLKVSSKSATIVNKIALQNYAGAPLCDLEQGTIDDGELFGSDNDYCGSAASAAYGWHYPSGGAPKSYDKKNGSMPFGAAIAVNGGASLPDLNVKKLDLMYETDGTGVVGVFTYWQKTFVRKLTGFSKPEGECVDKKNDVYITDAGTDEIVEYAHDGKTPLRTIKESPNVPYACAVDTGTGNLAIANVSGGSSGGGNIAVYAHATGTPTIYTDASENTFSECVYDDRGDLLVTDGEYPDSGETNYFAWLPSGGAKLVNISIPGPNKSFVWRGVEGLQWDGRYFVLDSYGLYRVAISNGEAYYIGSTGFDGEELYGPFAIYNKNPKKQATQFVGAYIDREGTNYNQIYYYNYPQGGESLGYLTTGLGEPHGLVVSLGTIHE